MKETKESYSERKYKTILVIILACSHLGS